MAEENSIGNLKIALILESFTEAIKVFSHKKFSDFYHQTQNIYIE